MKVYYLNREKFTKGDSTTALKFALGLAKKDKDINTITFLVYQAMQYDDFLGEIGFSKQHYSTHSARMGNYKVQVHTVKTYKPDYQFAGHPQSELLIAVGVPPKELVRFEDYSNINYWVIVPWLLEENKEWLSIFEATDLETGGAIASPELGDDRIGNAIDWLKATSYPNEGYRHPLDEDRLHQMSNAIKHYKVPFSYASAVKCGLEHGLIPSAARKTADAFQRAQSRAFAINYSDYGKSFLKEMMETKHDD